MKKTIILLFLSVMLLLAGCSGLKNGSYEGKSSEDSRGAYGVVKLKVEGGKITQAEFIQYNGDGTVKDENYGKEAGDENYQKAQNALKSAVQYAEKLMETQDIKKVDAISGATSSWNQFQEAAKDALGKAK